MKIENLQIEEVHCYEEDENNCGKAVSFLWSTSNIGFGELTLYQNEDSKWKANTEYMCKGEDKEFIRMVLNKWVDEIEVKE